MSAGIIFALVCAVIGIAYGAVSIKWILAQGDGNERMRQIAAAIKQQTDALQEHGRQLTAQVNPLETYRAELIAAAHDVVEDGGANRPAAIKYAPLVSASGAFCIRGFGLSVSGDHRSRRAG